MEHPWWKRPLRIVQYNLQVKDTPKMIPQEIGENLTELHANAVVLNVAGIYAWYPSRVPYHHINEYLPKGCDLLAGLIEACHTRGIRVIARFDFSKTDDVTYLQRPWWFVRQPDGSPRIYGKDRMGEWSLLASTCVNGGYRGEEFAIPVIREVLGTYDIDGIFFNAPHVEECYCDACREKYRGIYGTELPSDKKEFDPGWESRCLRDNMTAIYRAVKDEAPQVPVILYYAAGEGSRGTVENLDDRYATADLICTEAQDVLSLGAERIPRPWRPALNMKVGNSLPGRPAPCGIIHSSPGMDWRHTGIAPPEYLFWLSQIPANQGSLWHSLTGFRDTIADKRVLRCVGKVNAWAEACGEKMADATSAAGILLLWNGRPDAQGWAEGLLGTHHQYDLMDSHHIDLARMLRYTVVLLPGGFTLSEEASAIIEEYVRLGGRLLVETVDPAQGRRLAGLLGLERVYGESRELAAGYIRLEENCAGLGKGLEEAPLLPHRGRVLYCKAEKQREVPLTLVPPFAPLDGVGAPPERASIPVPRTDIPLCVDSCHGKGRVLFLPFTLGRLQLEYKLPEHTCLIGNCMDVLLGREKLFEMDPVPGIQAVVYQKGEGYLVHLVNGIGQRPLAQTVPYYNLKLSLKLGEESRERAVRAVISGQKVKSCRAGDALCITVSRLDVWEMLEVL